MFFFCKIKSDRSPRESLTHLVACNETIVMGMIDKSLLRVCLKNPKEPEGMYSTKKLYCHTLSRKATINIERCQSIYIYSCYLRTIDVNPVWQ